ncbi:MAG: long-chain fatty acid--CoA ligase [Alphaproteobacteria bacterium]|nr:long-chain fatty acid--CoA ligase [Alphaproteobacteria bacterium]MCY4498115.1 long-chain fatty acid--CoA ligase [Rhodospirillaceae bacterium]
MTDHSWLKSYPEGVDWNMPIPAKPLFTLLDDAVTRFPQRPCIDFLGRIYTYGELDVLVDRAASGFQGLGVEKGTKVGLFLPNCPQFVICYYAILKAGGTVVNYSPLYSEPELLQQIEDSQTDIMVTLNLTALYPKAQAMLEQSRLKLLVVGTMSEVLPFPKNWLFPLVKRRDVVRAPNDASHVPFEELLNNEGGHEPATIDPENDVAVLQYTGGTTGVPKGAMLTHANIFINTIQCGVWFPALEPGAERVMGVLPFFHVFAMTAVMNMSIHLGAVIIMHPRFELDAVLKDINKKRPTVFDGVPTMFGAINTHPKLQDFDLKSIKACISGGAPLPIEVKQRFEEQSGCKLVEGYGLTECSPVATCNPFSDDAKAGSIGLPMPGTVIEIVDRDDPGKVLPQGETGEICVSGPQVMAGYWRNEAATRDVIVDGRLRTGDVGYTDEDGYTFIIDRIKDLILVSGFNVYPRHVEDGIYQHPAVEEVTVIGVPDEYQGQSVKAFVKLREGQALGEEELRTFLQDRLGRHEVPKHIEFRDTLPKTMIGKLSKKELVAEEEAKLQTSPTETPAA